MVSRRKHMVNEWELIKWRPGGSAASIFPLLCFYGDCLSWTDLMKGRKKTVSLKFQVNCDAMVQVT